MQIFSGIFHLKRTKTKIPLTYILFLPGPISLLFQRVVYHHSLHLLMTHLSLTPPNRLPHPLLCWDHPCPSVLDFHIANPMPSHCFHLTWSSLQHLMKWTTPFFSWLLWHHPLLVFFHIIGHTISKGVGNSDSFSAQTVPTCLLR